VPVRAPLSTDQTLLAIDRAREVIGFAPGHSWRDHVAAG
jgi:UDP-glucose 4-epimerase